ncbi:MAG: arginine decarboxylase [Gammaproteobacteria bacterium HGW-Gammaproteobacteria-3]|nr:MAG: arginine decarboxylase [Gammaproteobacteria bacterium HGW-Gammaproteobacteria-3]
MSLTSRKAKLASLMLLANLGGCAEVAPWERGFLAKPQMALQSTSMQSAIRAHTFSSREAAANSGSAGGGGGCGCY